MLDRIAGDEAFVAFGELTSQAIESSMKSARAPRPLAHIIDEESRGSDGGLAQANLCRFDTVTKFRDHGPWDRDRRIRLLGVPSEKGGIEDIRRPREPILPARAQPNHCNDRVAQTGAAQLIGKCDHRVDSALGPDNQTCLRQPDVEAVEGVSPRRPPWRGRSLRQLLAILGAFRPRPRSRLGLALQPFEGIIDVLIALLKSTAI